MGITPRVTTRGRFVIQHEDAELPAPIVSERMSVFDAWVVNRKEPFTTFDIAEGTGLTVKQANNQLRRYQNRGLVTSCGKVYTGRRPLLSWKYASNASGC
jgi:hypothetical protein